MSILYAAGNMGFPGRDAIVQRSRGNAILRRRATEQSVLIGEIGQHTAKTKYAGALSLWVYDGKFLIGATMSNRADLLHSKSNRAEVTALHIVMSFSRSMNFVFFRRLLCLALAIAP